MRGPCQIHKKNNDALLTQNRTFSECSLPRLAFPSETEPHPETERVVTAEPRDDDGGDDSNDGPMRFIQLYTSPSFRDQRSKLVTPSEDWEQNHTDVSKHKFSPLVRGGGGAGGRWLSVRMMSCAAGFCWLGSHGIGSNSEAIC